jgi:serine/threonine-protein kinase
MREPAPSLRQVMPGAGAALTAAVDRALAFDRRDRFQSAGEMREALRAAYGEVRRRPPPPPRPRVPVAPTAPESMAVELVEAPSLVVQVAFGAGADRSG